MESRAQCDESVSSLPCKGERDIFLCVQYDTFDCHTRVSQAEAHCRVQAGVTPGLPRA